jgi:hypothetical protein
MKHLGSSFVVAREGITNKSLNAWCQREWTVLERRVGKAPQIPRAVGSVYVCSGSGASSDPDTRWLHLVLSLFSAHGPLRSRAGFQPRHS